MSRKNEAIRLIKELLENIESGDIIVDDVGVQEPKGGYILNKDGSLLSKITEIKLSEKRKNDE